MVLLLVDRSLVAAFSGLLLLGGAALFTGHTSFRPGPWPAGPHACFAEPPADPRRQPLATAAVNGTRFAAEDGRLDDGRVVAALREVIQAYRLSHLLHYPCGDMAWAGPVVAALQVRWLPAESEPRCPSCREQFAAHTQFSGSARCQSVSAAVGAV